MIRNDRPEDSALGSCVQVDTKSGPAKPRNRGFTLIEMLIVVALVGILAAISYPSYRWAIERSYKAEAKTNLTSLALLLEQHRSVYGCYGQRVAGVCPTAAATYNYRENNSGTATTDTITAWLNFNPRLATEVEADEGVRYRYRIRAWDDRTPPEFRVIAIPVTSRGAPAGNLTLTQAGAKTGWKR